MKKKNTMTFNFNNRYNFKGSDHKNLEILQKYI